jgi:Fe(3+) dicitrate transport protein
LVVGDCPQGCALELQWAYTFTDARFTSSFSSDFDAWGDVEAGDFLPYLSRHQFTTRLGWTHGRLASDVSARWTEGMRTIAGSEHLSEVETVGEALVADAAIRYQISESMRIELGVLNLMNQVYKAAARPAGLRPGLPRTLSVGFHLDF